MSEYHHTVDPPLIPRLYRSASITFQQLLDRSSPHTSGRWIGLIILFILYGVRVWTLQGFYIVTYGLGIFLLNLLIGFLSPLDEDMLGPSSSGSGDDGGPILPLNDADAEFKPFMRRLPEFKFWYSCTKAVVVAMTMTLFPFFDVPVFWPILLIYFIILFVLTMKRQIKHMMKHKYLPFNLGKKRYKGNVKKQAEDIRAR